MLAQQLADFLKILVATGPAVYLLTTTFDLVVTGWIWPLHHVVLKVVVLDDSMYLFLKSNDFMEKKKIKHTLCLTGLIINFLE
jgi:hypothetical protein